jgi:PAT family beta-lactamase induction signal transducer AmpG
VTFTATQYALLTSLAVVGSHTIGGFSGYLAASVGFQGFYALAMLCALPAMILMIFIIKIFPRTGAA